MESRKSFFDRHPWGGALFFFGLLVAVGLVLVFTIGERPHYRSSWKLVTERPEQGGFVPDSAHASDAVHVQVRVRVENADRSPGNGLEAALFVSATGEILSRGVTGPPGGHLLLPVPARLDQVLFEGGLEVLLRIPGEAPRTESVPEPDRGESRILFELGKPAPERLVAAGRVLRPDGRPAPAATVIARPAAADPAAAAAGGLGALTGDDGRFVVRGAASRDRYWVLARAEGMAARTDSPVPAGSLELELRLAPSGSLSGTLAFRSGSPPGPVRVLLHAAFATGEAIVAATQVSPEGDAAFRFDDLTAGVYALLIEPPGRDPLRLDGLVLKPGESSADPRLQRIGL